MHTRNKTFTAGGERGCVWKKQNTACWARVRDCTSTGKKTTTTKHQNENTDTTKPPANRTNQEYSYSIPARAGRAGRARVAIAGLGRGSAAPAAQDTRLKMANESGYAFFRIELRRELAPTTAHPSLPARFAVPKPSWQALPQSTNQRARSGPRSSSAWPALRLYLYLWVPILFYFHPIFPIQSAGIFGSKDIVDGVGRNVVRVGLLVRQEKKTPMG